MNRLDQFIDGLREGDDDQDIAAGLTNGDIEKPEWASISEGTDHLKIWDSENGGSAQMGFYRINY